MVKLTSGVTHVRLLEVKQIPSIFSLVKPMIDEVVALMPNEVNTQIIKHELLVGKARLIVVDNYEGIHGIAILKKVVYPTGYRVMTVPVLIGKQMPKWIEEATELAIYYARHLHCSELRGFPQRKSWIRFLRKSGWVKAYEVVTLKL